MTRTEEVLPAVPSSVAALRHHAVAFATEHGGAPAVAHAVALAVSEVVSNAVLHAYRGGEPGPVRLSCSVVDGRVVVEVADEGVGMSVRDDSPGLGHGLASVGARVEGLDVRPGPDGRGTVVRMTFGADGAPSADAGGLEPLCALALERLADVSCVDVVGEGVLRRACARVRDDEDLAAWLLTSAPPSKPGTATWAALREGGARLVEHDPTVARSPGGPGDRLDLRWWVAVPLEAADGAPAALWGLGGRAGGRPVPAADVVAALADAASGDLSEPAARDALRTRLAALTGT